MFMLLSFFSLAFMLGILFNLNIVDRVKTTKELAMMINTQKKPIISSTAHRLILSSLSI